MVLEAIERAVGTTSGRWTSTLTVTSRTAFYTMTTKTNWYKILTLRSEHRVFQNGDRYAIADKSGLTPDRTDDGPLWIDCLRPIDASATRASVPVLSDDGEEYRVMVYVDDVAALLGVFPGWPVEVQQSLARAGTALDAIRKGAQP